MSDRAKSICHVHPCNDYVSLSGARVTECFDQSRCMFDAAGGVWKEALLGAVINVMIVNEEFRELPIEENPQNLSFNIGTRNRAEEGRLREVV